jgi:hypothetical protein
MDSSKRTCAKQISCRYFSQGYCRYGDICKFKHAINKQPCSDFSQFKDVIDKRSCRDFSRGICRRGDRCAFQHIKSQQIFELDKFITATPVLCCRNCALLSVISLKTYNYKRSIIRT